MMAEQIEAEKRLHFLVLPAPPGYQLIEIDMGNACEGRIDRWISKPQPVLGFVIRKSNNYANDFAVLPMTAFAVYDDGGHGEYALIRPDGTIDYCHCGEYVFESLEDLKRYILRFHAQVWRELAEDQTKEDAANSRRLAKNLENEADELS